MTELQLYLTVSLIYSLAGLLVGYWAAMLGKGGDNGAR